MKHRWRGPRTNVWVTVGRVMFWISVCAVSALIAVIIGMALGMRLL